MSSYSVFDLYPAISFIAYGLHGTLGAVLAALFSLLYKDYPRIHLKLWKSSWIALALFAWFGVAAAAIAIVGLPIWMAAVFGTISLVAGYWHPTLLLLGTYAFATGADLSTRSIRNWLFGVTAIALAASVIPPLTVMELWIFLGSGVSSLIFGVAFIATGFWIRRTDQWRMFRGARIAAGTIIVAGINQILFFMGVGISMIWSAPGFYTIFRLLDVPIVAVLAVGMTIWFLEEERARRTDLEKRLQYSEKMETLGRLSGNVSHDFNNLLTVISGLVDLLRLNPNKQTEQFNSYLDSIDETCEKGAKLTRQLLAFSRREVVALEATSLSDVVSNVEDMLGRVTSSGVKIQVSQGKDGSPKGNRGKIRCDQMQMERVLLNLVLNANDAMPAGGTINLHSSFSTIFHPINTRTGRLEKGIYGVLEIRDTGMGMDEETLNHIFEPFYTTKGMKGSGLGLASAFGIVRQHRGVLDVESEPGVGTTFRIYLPLIDGGPADTMDSNRTKGERAGPERLPHAG